MRFFAALLMALTLSACTVVEQTGSRKVDHKAGARDRVAMASEYLRKGENEPAQVQLRKALELDEDSPEAHHLMAVVQERDGDVKEADREYRRAIKLKPDYSAAHNNYGVFLLKNNRCKEAIKQFDAASADLGYDLRAQSFEGMGRCQLREGDKDGAARSFSRALKLDGNLSVAALQFSGLLFEQKNFQGSRELYQRYLKLTGKQSQTAASLWLGIRLERHFGDNKDALASYELALRRLYPASPEYKLYQESLKAGQ
ncbi:MAG: type IV pilus biogenesis/stability protein PilW [Moraxellaceae bacterium]